MQDKKTHILFFCCVVICYVADPLQAKTPEADNPGRLFPANLPEAQWVSFEAAGFEGEVDGVIYRGSRPAADGMPLGGIETGCLDLETNGLFGYCSIFNSIVPRRGPLNEPFLGMVIGNQTWILSTCGIAGCKFARQIDYWGHFPIANMEYDLDAPVAVHLRAWSPFIPGDVHNSNIPGAIFELHLQNTTDQNQAGTVAFNFPGFDRYEIGYSGITRTPVTGPVNGYMTADRHYSGGNAYLLGVIDEPISRRGGGLGWDAEKWQGIASGLPAVPGPQDHENSATSIAVDFDLPPHQEKVIRFVLAWYFPTWQGGGDRKAGGNTLTHMYARNYEKVEDVANKLAAEHNELLARTMAWQQVVYDENTLPGWLKDTLINSLHMIPETSLWAQAKPPIGDWCRPEDGVFGMNECPRSCPQMECIPCTFYGNIPLVYFFPELALSNLRAQKAYQSENGRPAWIFGTPSDLASPEPGYQFVLNGSCLAEIFNKLWLRQDKDRALLEEFYPMVKKATVFTMTLRPDYGVKQVISMPDGNAGQEWFESTTFYGMCSHIGGVHLAHLQMAQEWAQEMGDTEFAQQCKAWYDGGAKAMEEHLWSDTHYLLYNEPETGHRSDVVMGYQLDGEWISYLHGYDGVFQSDRVTKTLETLKRINANPELCPHGALVFADPGGGLINMAEYNPGYWTDRGIHLPSVLMLAMTYIYTGERAFGLDLARRGMENVICRQRAGWDWTILYDGTTGTRIYGNDYYQDLVIWSMPAALNRQELSEPCQPGGLVDRMIQAANERTGNQ